MTTSNPPEYYFIDIDFNTSFYNNTVNQNLYDSRYLLKNYPDTCTALETFNNGLITNGNATINGVLQCNSEVDLGTLSCQGLTSGSSTNGLINNIYGLLQLNNATGGTQINGGIVLPDNSTGSNVSIRGSVSTAGINISAGTIYLFSSSNYRLSISGNNVTLGQATFSIPTNSGIAYAQNTITAATYLIGNQNSAFLNFNATSNSIVVTLAVASIVAGQKFKILVSNASTNTVSLSGTSTQFLNVYSGGTLTVINNSPSSFTYQLSNNTFYELICISTTLYYLYKISV